MTALPRPRLPFVCRDDDGTWFILCEGGAAASFKDGVWHPGSLWDGRTLCDYRAVDDPAEIMRCFAEASEALSDSLKE